jgi:hypothetical protein
MARTIFLQVGTRDRVPLNSFIGALQDFLGILRDLDSTISQNRSGSVIWEVVSLAQESPPTVGVSPQPRPKMIDVSWQVESQLLENVTLLNSGTNVTREMSFAALQRFEGLASRTRQLGPHKVYVNGAAEPRQESVISERTLVNVKQLTEVRYSGYGTLVGALEEISVHKKNEFRIWDRTTGKPIRCRFEPEQREHVVSLLGVTVGASGIIMSNREGIPVAMDVEELEPFEIAALPTISEMSGLVKGITDGKPLKQYLEELDDD